MRGEALHHVVVGADVAFSGELENDAKLRMRRIVYDVAGRGFAAAGIHAGSHEEHDRGDGFLAVLTEDIPGTRIAGPWLQAAYWALSEHNEALPRPLRLRVAMHVGTVHRDEHGPSGRALDLTCRLRDSVEAKALLAAVPDSPLVVVVSGNFHESVVRGGGPMIERGNYVATSVRVDGVPVPAWFHVPGRRTPRDVPAGSVGPPTPAATPAATPPGPTVSAGRDAFAVIGDGNRVNQDIDRRDSRRDAR